MEQRKKIKIIIAVISISFIQGLQYCVSPVLNAISAHYPDVPVSMVQMLVTAPAFLSMAVALLSGVLVVKVSKKVLLVFAGLAAGILGFLPLLSDSFYLLFLCRTLYGISLGLATALSTAVIADFFEGEERVSAMGIQAASVGAGMVVVNVLGGVLGAEHYENAYWINLIGFIAMALILFCLPDVGTAKAGEKVKIRLTKEVFQVSLFGILEFLFLITFTTNISMHLSGALAGDSSITGSLTGVFSATQIAVGLILVYITRVTKRYTLPAAMICFSIGALILVLFPSNFVMLMTGAVFCGLSQGIFIPTAMTQVSNAVQPISIAMASAVFTCAMFLGQLISPVVMNTASGVIFGEVTTTGVYIVAAVGMVVSAGACALWIKWKGAAGSRLQDKDC